MISLACLVISDCSFSKLKWTSLEVFITIIKSGGSNIMSKSRMRLDLRQK